ncbi:nuclear transport factor 2 family protein [Mycobacterium sp. 23]|uniref:nuclear transport factor 2 family protein n=1 Tax=Mycobacterium sp. 23 TaxID=3400424 RepID=UPI003AB0392F
MTTDERVIELLQRNLTDVFGEGDAARRRAAVDELYTGDCVLYVPGDVLVGRDAVDRFAGDLRASHPDFVYTHRGEPQALHNGGIFAWGSGPQGEAPAYTGLDVVVVRDDKIATLYVYLNPKLT